MRKKIFFGIFLVAFIAIAIYWFMYIREVKAPISNAINAIPPTAVIILESKQVKNTWKKLSQTNIMWEELMSIPSFSALNGKAKYIDSLLQLDPNVSALLDDHSVFLSAHRYGETSFDLLCVYSLPNLTHKSTLEQFILSVNSGKEPAIRDYAGVNISSIQPKDKDPLYFAFLNGTIMISERSSLVEEAIRQLKSGSSFETDKNFRKVLEAAGKNVDANLYINYKYFPAVLERLTLPSLKKEIAGFADFSDYSGWDITIKPNALMLSGFTRASDSLPRFLNLFSKQKPQLIELTKVIPSKTSIMLFFGISNMNVFHQDHKNYISSKESPQTYENYISSINKKYNINVENAMLHWMNNELALVITESTSSDLTNNSYAVIRSNDIDDAIKTLTELADTIAQKNEEKNDTSNFREHTISRLNIPEILPRLLGEQFNKIKENYFTSVNDYIVFANSVEALQDLINDFENNKTLIRDKNYKTFSENISAEANIYLYSSIARSSEIYKTFVRKELAQDLDINAALLKKFEAIGIQFTANKDLFYSNIYLKYNPAHKQESGTLWELKLDTTLTTRPYLLVNHNTKAKDVLIQDDANKIYLISNTGKIIWTKQLHEKIMSDVVQVDVLKNDKLQMIFNTRSYIYMFDRNGNDMKGFPIILRSPATNAISVTDYEKNRDYRIFIATENKRIICYKANGEQLTAFKFDKTSNVVYLPVQYFNAGNKDHLCVIDVKGKMYILNRHGEVRIKMKELMAPGTRNFFVDAGKDYSRSYIVGADTLGNIIKVSLSGDRESIKIQDFETSPYFEYKDINNDKTKEYIFLTRNELKVFSPDRTLLFNHEFKNKITQTPLFFLFPDGKGKIGVGSEETNELYLFNENGSLYTTFPLSGKTPFSIGDMNNERTFNLITGSSDNSIYVYQLQ